MKNIVNTLKKKQKELDEIKASETPITIDFTGYGEQLMSIGATVDQIQYSIKSVSEGFNLLLNLAYQDIVKDIEKNQKLN
jgi:hypothetical protein